MVLDNTRMYFTPNLPLPMFHRQWSWESESLLSLKHLYIGMGIYMGTEEYMYWESKESGLR